jgi:2,3,4,5-tetrahydropyridine-2-carboxylate N-succinyltransferase
MENFKKLIKNIQSQNTYKNPIAFAIARIQLSQKDINKTIQAIYPTINWQENFGSFAVFTKALEGKIDFSLDEQVIDIDKDFIDKCLEMFSPFIDEAKGDAHKNIQTLLTIKDYIQDSKFRLTIIFNDSAVKSVETAYLKLYALSLKKVKPRSIVLDGAFGILPNVAWSGTDAYDLDYLRENEIKLKVSNQYPMIDFVDKFPRFLMHIIPEDNVRILDSSKVRFGAYVSAGTTVMPGASYINFNAGTLGTAMVEGRISSSATVGNGTDVGGGASILGVLSGTDGNPITIGENCLLGANSTCGIPLGDGCIIDGGITILAGTKVKISDKEIEELKKANPNSTFDGKDNVFKAKELSSMNGLHFRQDSINGNMLVMRSKREVILNKDLH